MHYLAQGRRFGLTNVHEKVINERLALRGVDGFCAIGKTGASGRD